MDVTAIVEVGTPLSLQGSIGAISVEVQSDDSLPKARTQVADEDSVRLQLDRFGNTAYELGRLIVQLDGQAMVPHGVFGQARRRLIEELDTALQRPVPRKVAQHSVIDSLRPVAATDSTPTEDTEPQLHVLTRSLQQLLTLLELGERTLIADFADIREFKEAVLAARAANARLLLATPRIQKPDEMGIFSAMDKHEPDGVLARNLSGLAFFRPLVETVVADFSLNCTNELTAGWLKERGADRITASYDMNRDQLLEMVAATPSAWLEIVVHQHMPMFHMEHCVFCAVLSPGTNKTNCGRPCDFHEVTMRDRVGMEHPLHADVGCRNTLFNAQPQSGAEAVPALLNAGLRHFRIELLGGESQNDTARLIQLYRDLMAGRKPPREVWTELKAANRVGVTRGTLEHQRNPLHIL